MIDSVLKGTGNSRFLKSAVPVGTSWADALAMLQAGTFPIDFNGINTEGFQQVGTPLNKANLLKDATAAQIGLPPSTTPDGMFQALGNTGELHVWRKTVTTAQEIPAGYTLGEATAVILTASAAADYGWASYYAGTGVSVNDAGDVTLTGAKSYDVGKATSFTPDVATVQTNIRGKFVRFYLVSSDSFKSAYDGILYIPSDATLSYITNATSYGDKYNGGILCDKAQLVKGYPLTPAGTTTTYPVSTNPKAYQEGDDAKAAGYVVGEEVTGDRAVTNLTSVSTDVQWKYGDVLAVSDDGTISISNPSTRYLQGNNVDSATYAQQLLGHFVTCTQAGTGFTQNVIYYIPADAKITKTNHIVYVDRYQPVTGYAAIPAGTTIEYLGKLGDKARVQVLSYVGTGTYGSSNPNSVTASFPIKLLAVLTKALKNSNGNFTSRIDFNNQYREDPFMVGAALTTEYTLGSGCGYKVDSYDTSYGKKSNDGKTFSWYTTGSNAARQFNESGYTYTVLLIG